MIIAVEGIDGSGKTSLIEQLKQTLSLEGIKSKLYSENSIPEIKKLINQLISSNELDYSPYTHLFLAVSEYLLLQQEILQEHHKGTVVLWDRYISSTIVYSRVFGVYEQTIQMVISNLTDIVDMSIFCDVIPAVALKRKEIIDNIETGFQNSNNKSCFINFQERIYNAYWQLINENNSFWYIYKETSCGYEQILQEILRYQNKDKIHKILTY